MFGRAMSFLGQRPSFGGPRQSYRPIPAAGWEKYAEDDDEANINAITQTLNDYGYAELADYIGRMFTGAYHFDRDHTARLQAELDKRLAPCTLDKRLDHLVLALLANSVSYAWERTLHHEPIHAAVTAITRHYERRMDRLEPSERDLVKCFLNYYEIIACGMRIENSLNISCSAGIMHYTSKALALQPPLSNVLAVYTGDAGAGPVCRWLERRILDHIAFFAAVRQAAVVFEHWRRDPQPPESWDPAASAWVKRIDAIDGQIAEVQNALLKTSPWLSSELRAHRASLQKLKSFGHARSHTFDDFTFTYCFPFVIKDFNRHSSKLLKNGQTAFEAMSKQWSTLAKQASATPLREVLPQLRPLQFKTEELTDVWTSEPDIIEELAPGSYDPADPAPGEKFYKVCSFVFPSLTIEEFRGEGRSITLTCELRITSFGAHYIRMSCSQDDFSEFDAVTAHDVYRAMRRVSSLAGNEDIRVEGCDFAVHCRLYDVADAILDMFSAAIKTNCGKDAQVFRDLAKTSNVICSIRNVTRPGAPGFVLGTAIQNSDLGRLLLNSVGGPADRLEPWLCREAHFTGDGGEAERRMNAAAGDLVEDSLILKTYNTTFISLPTSPNFMYLDYEEMSEFVAALEPLYIYWNKDIDESLDAALASLRQKSLRVSENNLEKLYGKIVVAKKAINEIRSSRLVTNSIYRTFLDRLIDASTVRSLEQDFDKLTITAQELQKVITDHGRASAARKSAAYQIVLGVAAVLIAILQIVQAMR